MLDVVGFGESSVDFVHVVPELPQHGVSKLQIASHYTASGGQVATAMAGCAALGLKAAYLGPVGNDANGKRIRDELRAHGVDLSRLIVRQAPNRFAVILVSQETGDRVVLWERDRRLDLPPDEISAGLLPRARIVHVDATDEPASIVVARLARAAGSTVTCDIDTVTTRTGELLSHVTIPILAEHVPQALTGSPGIESALRQLRLRHEGLLIVTLGAQGAAALDGDRYLQIPAVEVETTDTTGAGDIFRSGFIYAHLQGWSTERALRFANAAAAVSCSRQGALAGAPALSEVLAVLSSG